MTLYALLLARCGLSHREAAAYHAVRLDTVKSWSAGRNRAPPGALAELRELYRAIERTAASALVEIGGIAGDAAAGEIELGIATTEAEARELGLPCVGAHAALLGIVAARLDRPVAIVPRGSTAATAAAVRARRHPMGWSE